MRLSSHRQRRRGQGGIAAGWWYLIGVAAFAGALVWLYNVIDGRGYARGESDCKAAQAKANKLVRDDEQKKGAAASSGLEAGNEKARIVFRTITRHVDRIVDRPIYRNVCLDADGLRCVNAALNGATRAAGGESDACLPAADAARGRDGGGGVAQNR